MVSLLAEEWINVSGLRTSPLVSLTPQEWIEIGNFTSKLLCFQGLLAEGVD